MNMFYTEKFCQFCSLLCLAGEEADSVSPVVTALMMVNDFHAHTTTKSDADLQSVDCSGIAMDMT
jgi:hypothetical protein